MVYSFSIEVAGIERLFSVLAKKIPISVSRILWTCIKLVRDYIKGKKIPTC